MVITRNKAFIEGLEKMIKYIASQVDTKQLEMAEIGCNAGTGTELFAKYFKKVYAIDPWAEDFEGNNIKEAEAEFNKIANKYKNIVKIKMTSEEASRLFKKDSIDLVYIDALHDYINVKADLKYWIPKVKETGWITGHDYWPKRFPGVIKAVNERLTNIKTFPDTSYATRRSNAK